MKIEVHDVIVGVEPTVINTSTRLVKITDAFNGVTFITDEGEQLNVIMRNGGYEVHYLRAEGKGDDFDTGWTTFHDGVIRGHTVEPVVEPINSRAHDPAYLEQRLNRQAQVHDALAEDVRKLTDRVYLLEEERNPRGQRPAEPEGI